MRRTSPLVTKLLIPGITAAICVTALTSQASNWTGATGNWSSDGNPGWNGTGVPNAQGALAEYSGGSGATTDQNIALGVTVGSIQSIGAGNASWNINISNSITLDQDGGGSGSALIETTRTSAFGHRLNINSGAGSLILADNLIVRNTGNGTSSSGSIQLNANITGTGNITFDNASSNNAALGQIYLNSSSTSDFTGNVLVRRGAVSFNDKDHFGNKATNVITLGEASQGSVTLVSANTPGTVINNIVAAASTSGTSILGSISSAASGNTTYSGTVLLNGDLSLTSSMTGTGYVSLSNTISGAGSLTKTGAGVARLAGVNTYTGDTTVSAGTLLLVAGSEQRFEIQDSNASNQILGSGIIEFNGVLRLDISGLTASSGTWNLIDVASLSETFGGSFGVAFLGGPTFTADGFGNYTSGDWTFAQSTGNLVLVPEPGTIGLLGLGGFLLMLRARRRGKVSVS